MNLPISPLLCDPIYVASAQWKLYDVTSVWLEMEHDAPIAGIQR